MESDVVEGVSLQSLTAPPDGEDLETIPYSDQNRVNLGSSLLLVGLGTLVEKVH